MTPKKKTYQEILQATGLVPPLARASDVAGDQLRRDARCTACAMAVKQATLVADAAGTHALLCERCLRTLRYPPHAGRVNAQRLAPLERYRQIAALLGEGKTYVEIGAVLSPEKPLSRERVRQLAGFARVAADAGYLPGVVIKDRPRGRPRD